jgi:hypothetical protein
MCYLDFGFASKMLADFLGLLVVTSGPFKDFHVLCMLDVACERKTQNTNQNQRSSIR